MIPEMATPARWQKYFSLPFGQKKLIQGLCIFCIWIFWGSSLHGQDTIPPVISKKTDTIPLPSGTVVVPENDTVFLVPDRVGADVLQNDTLPDSPTDSLALEEHPKHSPVKATMLSVALPGLGQAYNGKYWKIPFIYAGFGGVIYALNFNNTQYQQYRRAWIAKIDGNPNTVDEFPNISPDRIQRAMNGSRRNLEITYIVGGIIYLLNVLDATVDAHLLDFDVGRDLTLNVQPMMLNGNGTGNHRKPAAGVSLSFRF